MRVTGFALIALLALTAPAAAFPAAYTEYTDKTAWDTAYDVGDFATLTFVGNSDGAILTTQYTTQGATFTAGTHAAIVNGSFADGTGLQVGTGATVWFGTPVCAIAADHPAGLQLVLRDAGGTIIATSAQFGGAGTGLFAGVISIVPVSSVAITDWTDNSGYIDNLMFGPCPPDGDGDGVADAADNCPGADNAGQEDADEDGYGDLCDPPSCGNGLVEAPEACDGAGETGTCNLDCSASACGDGVINVAAGEACDGGDGCEDDCTLTPPESCPAVEDGGGGGGCDAGGAGASPWLLLIGLGALVRRR